MSTTDDLMSQLGKDISDERALEEYLERIGKYGDISKTTFSEYYGKLLKKRDFSSGDIEKRTGLEHSFCNKMINGKTRITRNNMLALAIAAELELEEVEKCLMLTNNGALYPKDTRDAVIIYSINRRLSLAETNNLLYSKNMELLGQIRDQS
ncbi:MAG: hypothetical protein K6E10_11230 [Eubacterium sp.]|nr:hypothetical protein [Eubacterium sp.]